MYVQAQRPNLAFSLFRIATAFSLEKAAIMIKKILLLSSSPLDVASTTSSSGLAQYRRVLRTIIHHCAAGADAHIARWLIHFCYGAGNFLTL